MPTTAADHLRARALALRTFARRVQQLEVLTLASRAGTDTWVGPSPHACEAALRAGRTRVLTRVDELMAAARRLERQADALAVVAAASGPR